MPVKNAMLKCRSLMAAVVVRISSCPVYFAAAMVLGIHVRGSIRYVLLTQGRMAPHRMDTYSSSHGAWVAISPIL
jgi:hypothetical protein